MQVKLAAAPTFVTATAAGQSDGSAKAGCIGNPLHGTPGMGVGDGDTQSIGCIRPRQPR